MTSSVFQPSGLRSVQGLHGVEGLHGVVRAPGLHSVMGLHNVVRASGPHGVEGLRGVVRASGLHGVLQPSGLRIAMVIVSMLAAAAAAQGARIYRIDTNAMAPPVLHAYELASNSWTVLASLPAANTTCLASDGRQIYALPEDGMVYTYNPTANTWDPFMPGPAAAVGRNAISMFEIVRGEFYWGKDNASALHYTSGGVWTQIATPRLLSSASDVDESTGLLYVRRYGNLGVFVFDPATASFPTICDTGFNINENNRTGVLLNGIFYNRDFPPGAEVYATDMSTCVRTGTGDFLNTGHSSATAALGQIYLNGYAATQTVFERYDPPTGAITLLAPAPVLGALGHSALAFVNSRVDILLVDTAPVLVAPGQLAVAVQVTIENLNAIEAIDVTAVTLLFTGTADRASDYLVTPAPGNPAAIPPLATAVFDFTVDVLATAVEEHVVLDAEMTGTLAASLIPVQPRGALVSDSWDVLGARIAARVVDAAATTVLPGSTGNPVTVSVENTGLNPWTPSAIQLSFTGTLDRSAEYTVTPSPANPALVAPGAIEVFSFDVAVDALATAELITIDVAMLDGVDAVTARPQGDSGADTTDAWMVAACAAPLCGDCDLNLTLNVLDALKASRISAGLIAVGGLTLQELDQCDVDNGGVIDILDALRLAQLAAGLPVAVVCC